MPKRIRSAVRTDLREFPRAAALVGVAVACWAQAEESLTHLLALLLGVDIDTAQVVFYASNSEKFRTTLIRELAAARVTEDAARKALLDAVRGFENLIPERNLLIHGLWKNDRGGRLSIIATRKGPIRWFAAASRVPARRLEKFIESVEFSEMGLMSAHNAVRLSLPQTPPPPAPRRRQRARHPKKSASQSPPPLPPSSRS